MVSLLATVLLTLLPETAAASGLPSAATGSQRDITAAKQYPFPDTEDQLMANFVAAYSARNIDGYREVLHDDFRFMFQQADIQNFGLPTNHLDRDQEIAISQVMFSGAPGPGGVPGISQIAIQVFVPQTAWEDVGDHPDFPGSRHRIYAINMDVVRPNSTTLQVQGQAEFFVVSQDSMTQGGVLPYWQILGHLDQTETKAVESASWGTLKILYWAQPNPTADTSWGKVKALYR
jgi:hypothetical protein